MSSPSRQVRRAEARRAAKSARPRKGPLPAGPSKYKRQLLDAVEAYVQAEAVFAPKALAALRTVAGLAMYRLAPMNRAAARKVQRFGRTRNWSIGQFVVELMQPTTRVPV